jgi:hypothetical protein
MTTAAALNAWLCSPRGREVEAALDRAGMVVHEALQKLALVTEDAATIADVLELRERLPCRDLPVERWLLVRKAVETLDTLAAAMLPDACRALTEAEIARLVAAELSDRAIHVSRPRFREFAKIVTGRRFAAGLLHFEIDGIPRQWLLNARYAELPRVWWFVATRMRGLRPVIVPHLTGRRPLPPITAGEVNRSYALMAQLLEQRPDLKGLAGASWLRSPDTHRVSPRLACVNRVIVANGGLETVIGPAPADCGVLTRSETRRRMFEAGLFAPTIGLTLWPRDAMITWARANPAMVSAA